MRTILFILAVLFSFKGLTQNQANTWYFGENAGLDFNSGAPLALMNGTLSTQEGCASISNDNGAISFYTDGLTVYDANHSVMQNGTGLLGHASSTQSAIIVPNPANSDLYYIFTVDTQSGTNGLQYSEVDMLLNGGLGAITSNKNIPLISPTLEKVTAVKHANGNDIWVITHERGSNAFYSYLVSNSGVSSLPVISNVGNIIGSFASSNNIGYLKASPNGVRLAMAHQSGPFAAEIFDFDSSSGTVSNPVSLFSEGIGNDRDMYGVEFSTSSDVLYLSELTGGVFQYDLNSADIEASELQLVGGIANNGWGGLQLGPDGKIYVSRSAISSLGAPDIHFLSVIDDPNTLGVGCNFQLDTISLGTGVSTLGLPPFIQSYFFVGFKYENLCFGDTTQYNANISQPYDSLIWDFGDGAISTVENPSHIYATAGTYTVTLSVTSGGITTTDEQDVIIYEQPMANSIPNQMYCDDQHLGELIIDMSTYTADILNGQDPTLFSVTYYDGISNYNNGIEMINSEFPLLTLATSSPVASVRNINNPSCEAITIINVSVLEGANPSQNISPIRLCDNTSIGTDIDGIIEFDLTIREMDVLNGQSASDFTVNYYTDSGLTNLILDPTTYQNTIAIETIYVQVVNNLDSTCAAETSFDIEVLELPSIISPIVELRQCDDDLDGFSSFNLTEAYSKISANYQNEIISFYETQVEAENNISAITNITSYLNQTVSTDNIWVRRENNNGCYRIVQIDLIVSTTQIPTNFIREFYKCDDDSDGDMFNGITTFDFSSVDAEIRSLFPIGQQLIINYYESLNDALQEVNAIPDISNHSNVNSPVTQNIYIRVDSELDNDCLGLGMHITLNVEVVPIANPVTVEEVCDPDGDGLYEFDTALFDQTIIGSQTNVEVLYFDASRTQLTTPLPNPFVTATQDITARVINSNSQDPNGQCFDETIISFNVQAAAVAHNIEDIIECDLDNDGIVEFNTLLVNETVLNGQVGMNVFYFDENNNALPSPLPNPFLSNTQTIRVRVENSLSAACFDEITFNLIRIEQPELLMSDTWTICEGDSVQIIADDGFDEYSWSTGETTSTITVTLPGAYNLTAANTYGGVRCEDTKEITVLESNVATIINIEIEDWSNNNNVITVLTEGDGDYEYSLDGINFQDDNRFDNVSVNNTLVYVRDKKGCGTVTEEFYLLYYPKFFTPNDDGYHDTWQLYNASENSISNVYIYDRYGKLLKELNPKGIGWDGTFNGSKLPSSDYWFSLIREDGRQYRGHFTLKR